MHFKFRKLNELETARDEIISQYPSAKVNCISCDVTDLKMVKSSFALAQKTSGPVNILICNAGAAITGKFIDIPMESFKRGMDLNYFGTVAPIKEVVPGMKSNGGGSIALVSSGAGVASYIGYSAYAPTKWAMRGFADTLRNELCGDNISVHIAYPPNMPTAGFEEEEKTKPAEAKAIEAGTVTTISPKDVAKSIVNGIQGGTYHIPCVFDHTILLTFMAGISPRSSLLLDMVLLPILVPVTAVYRYLWDSEVIKRSK